MSNLNNKIINKVYLYEAKRTFGQIIFIVFLLLFSLAVFLLIGSIIKSILIEQNTFDFFEILSQNIEVIRKFLVDDFFVFLAEIPKTLIFIFLSFFILLIYLIFRIVKNFKKNKNKVKSIINFWSKKI